MYVFEYKKDTWKYITDMKEIKEKFHFIRYFTYINRIYNVDNSKLFEKVLPIMQVTYNILHVRWKNWQ